MSKQVKLNELHIKSFFQLDHVEVEPDGSIFVRGPIAATYLSEGELLCCMRFMAARLGVNLKHSMPARSWVVTCLRDANATSRSNKFDLENGIVTVGADCKRE